MNYGDLITHRFNVYYAREFDDDGVYLGNIKRVFTRKLRTPYRFRIDPVPNTRKPKNGHYYRRIRTTQERRKLQDALEQGVHVRGNRKLKMLPSSWNAEKPVHTTRSWKEQKKRKQWM